MQTSGVIVAISFCAFIVGVLAVDVGFEEIEAVDVPGETFEEGFLSGELLEGLHGIFFFLLLGMIVGEMSMIAGRMREDVDEVEEYTVGLSLCFHLLDGQLQSVGAHPVVAVEHADVCSGSLFEALVPGVCLTAILFQSNHFHAWITSSVLPGDFE